MASALLIFTIVTSVFYTQYGGQAMLMEKQEELKNQLLTVKEVATYLVVTERTVYRLVKDRRFPAFKVGGQWRFKVDLIEAWMRRDRSFEYEEANA